MDVTETMDREVIVERAEAVRFWLLGLPLSSRVTSAIQRELGAIISDDPGEYTYGQRPLAGLNVADFIDELHRPNGGAVGRVKRVSDSVLNEIRAAIRATSKRYVQVPSTPAGAVPEVVEAPAPVGAMPEAVETPAPVSAVPEALEIPASADVIETSPAEDVPPPRRRPGRPKGSTKKARNGIAPPQVEQSATEQPKPRRGRPRRQIAPPAVVTAAATNILPETLSPPPIAPTAYECNDPTLNQIIRLWPSLHPHARRAVVIYTSMLWAETAHEK
ncbi:MAG: hypothetical protein WCK70_09030 [Chloroflexales bacterium]